MLSATTSIPLPGADNVLVPLCAHLGEHGAVVIIEGAASVVTLGAARAVFRATNEMLDITIDAGDLGQLRTMKLAIASHIVEFAPPGAIGSIVWTGDAADASLPPDFRVLTVIGAEAITPHMRRIRFRGTDLARFDTLEALHVRLFIPPAGLAEPLWPMIGADGLIHQPPDEQRPVIRKYTIREIDVEAGTLAIDFVVHDDAGPGAAFAARAQTGDRIGMAGPGGRGLREAERYFFLADETGLPAVARMLEHLPADAIGLAMIEVVDGRAELPLRAPSGIAIRWLHRGQVAAGTSRQLADAFAALPLRPGDPRTYLWAALEHEAFKKVRSAARLRLRPEADQHLIVSYWRSGLSEDQHELEKKAARRAS